VLNYLRLTPVGRLARHARWALASIGGRAAAPPAGRLSVRLPRSVMEAGVPVEWVVRLENHSRDAWPRIGPGRVQLKHQWIARTGQKMNEARHGLPRTLLPGDWIDVPVDVAGPSPVGDFTLVWEAAVAGRAMDAQSLSERVPVFVTFPRSSDIDYHHVYRTADLAANSWWVVGAYHTAEQYRQSSRDRRAMLIEQGMTPDSRVLDVGCGTGQMAMALEDYLSDRGAYYGTDIGREAIDYCRRHFRRPNFVFDVGDMTRLPFSPSAAPFDLAIFFSVFTHTFVDESVLLLAETARLLGHKGTIIADIIVSDCVARGAGHRGQMWLNRDYFFRLAGMLGFTTAVIGAVPWGDYAERIMMRISRR
jgi:SAM-dependent methyltransferase